MNNEKKTGQDPRSNLEVLNSSVSFLLTSYHHFPQGFRLFRSQVLDAASPGTLVSAFNSSVFAFTSDVESSESTRPKKLAKEIQGTPMFVKAVLASAWSNLVEMSESEKWPQDFHEKISDTKMLQNINMTIPVS